MSSSQAESGVLAGNVTWAAASDRGRRRTNQDRFGVARNPSGWLLVVCDGLGGHRAGEVASAFASQRLLEAFRNGSEPLDLKTRVSRLSREIRVLGQRRPERAGLGTTVVALQVCGQRSSWVVAGDSRLYLRREGTARLLAEPHDLGRVLVREGVLHEGEQPAAPWRGRLTSYLGLEEPELACGLLAVRSGDRFALVTDGVLEAGEERVLRALAEPARQAACDALVSSVATQDNATAVVADIQPVERPCSES